MRSKRKSLKRRRRKRRRRGRRTGGGENMRRRGVELEKEELSCSLSSSPSSRLHSLVGSSSWKKPFQKKIPLQFAFVCFHLTHTGQLAQNILYPAGVRIEPWAGFSRPWFTPNGPRCKSAHSLLPYETIWFTYYIPYIYTVHTMIHTLWSPV